MDKVKLPLWFIILTIVFVFYMITSQSLKNQKEQCVDNEKFYTSSGRTYLCNNWKPRGN